MHKAALQPSQECKLQSAVEQQGMHCRRGNDTKLRNAASFLAERMPRPVQFSIFSFQISVFSLQGEDNSNLRNIVASWLSPLLAYDCRSSFRLVP